MTDEERNPDETDEEEDFDEEFEYIEAPKEAEALEKQSDQEFANELALTIRRYTFDVEECKKQIQTATKDINGGGGPGAHDHHVFWVHRLVGRQKYMDYAQPKLAELVAKGIFPVIPEETLKFRLKRMLGID